MVARGLSNAQLRQRMIAALGTPKHPADAVRHYVAILPVRLRLLDLHQTPYIVGNRHQPASNILAGGIFDLTFFKSCYILKVHVRFNDNSDVEKSQGEKYPHRQNYLRGDSMNKGNVKLPEDVHRMMTLRAHTHGLKYYEYVVMAIEHFEKEHEGGNGEIFVFRMQDRRRRDLLKSVAESLAAMPEDFLDVVNDHIAGFAGLVKAGAK